MAAESSLDKALSVLEAVARSGGGCRLMDLSSSAGYPPATLHRILSQLLRRGYVRQDPDTKVYQLGLKCLDVFSRVQSDLEITTYARPVMRRLMEKTGETVNLVVFDGDEAVYLDQVANDKALLRAFTRVGVRVPLLSSGVGKAYLSTRPEEEVVAYFRRVKKVRYTSSTLTREEDFVSDVALSRQRGYAVDREEYEAGVGCVACVVTQGSKVAGAISISGPSSRLLGAHADRLAGEVLRGAAAISKQLS